MPIRILLIGMGLLIVAMVASLWLGLETARRESNEPPPVAEITLGGPFSLVDHRGRPVTDGDFRGDFMLVYFGYTYCPDVCPTDLQTMVTALDEIGAAGDKVRPIFISVDPKRDTVAQLAEYVALFHPRMVGLTGTPEQIAAAAAAYYAHYLAGEFNGEYLVSHTANTYLMGPDGKYLTRFPHGTDPDEMAAEIASYVESSGG